jgi:uncharacterized protein YjbI with pentapeptide repeats
VFGYNSGIQFVDWIGPGKNFDPKQPTGRIEFLTSSRRRDSIIIDCRFAGWGRDEWIEYLLAKHKVQCPSVMRRVLNDAEIESLDGNPHILCQVLDELASDDQIPDVKSAFNRIVDRHFPDVEIRRAITPGLIQLLVGGEKSEHLITGVELSPEQSRLAYLDAVQIRLATETVWHDLTNETPIRNFLSQIWPRRLIAALAVHVAESMEVQHKLRGWLDFPHRFQLHPKAISLLNAAKAPWRLPSEGWSNRVNLAEIILDGADCTGKTFSHCLMVRASFEGANLNGVVLQKSSAHSANFAHAEMHRTRLKDFDASAASFAGADLSECVGRGASFCSANLTCANFVGARLKKCDFSDANLTLADFRRARLKYCIFQGANLDEADFSHADLFHTDFRLLDLTMATFEGASFRSAKMYQCQMQAMHLPGANFQSAILAEADLTGSIMPHANFSNAMLQHAKLAEVEWEWVDLRNADMRGATFHMGSSRSGLVGSSIPMYGSRTGFYTDDFGEQDFKAPEEIRTANLRGADLRGAKIDHVDFYLVDLRDAIYDKSQAEQLRRSGAILANRRCG